MFFLREPFPFPVDLSRALESALWPERGGRLLQQRGQALRRLWERLAKGRGQIAAGETHYSFRREEADAYAAYYLPANCLKPALLLEESFLLGENLLPEREAHWLDLGTGPGTALWGLAWWCANRGKKLRFTGWDQSAVFTDIARRLAASGPFGARAEFLSRESDPLQLVRSLAPTHVSFVNSLAEIYPAPETRGKEIARLLRALRELERKDGKRRHLILIEPGSRDSSRELAELKDHLQAEQAGFVSFPCLDARPCGALRDPKDWCHEEAACEFPDWVNALGALAGMRKEALLFSYAVIQTSARPRASQARFRVVSQRLERKGQVECRLCAEAGKRLARVQRSRADAQTEAFLACARGDLWASASLGEKGDVASFSPIQSGTPSLFQAPPANS